LITAVMDTNVWVAGVLSADGPPARIVEATLAGHIVAVVSPAILDEYEDVLRRRELSLPGDDVTAILAYLRLPGAHVMHADPAEVQRVCPDPDDDIFLATALAGGAAYLVTGNVRHFPRSPWRGVRIVEPARFARLLRA
jgi:putative PIN family toxin of toxin-antitoxin system